MYAGRYFYLKQDGTYWAWNHDNPTPQQIHENVSAAADGNIHFSDGRLIVNAGWNEIEFENVKIPQIITFN
jgi:hypothetical protein